MRAVLTTLRSGVDTDGDGLSDIAETRLSRADPGICRTLGSPRRRADRFRCGQLPVDRPSRREVAEEALATLSGLSGDLPILANQVTVIEAALAETGDDQDG